MNDDSTPSVPTADSGYIGIAAHVLLLLFTGWIWIYVWVYKLTHYTNIVKGEEYRNPTTKLLLCIFVPFYFTYWTYKTSQRIDAIGREKGDNGEIAVMSTVVSLFIPLVSAIIMQMKVNDVCIGKRPEMVHTYDAPQPSPAASSTADELKKYKELLDIGAITQEEFDAKKKQLLDL